MLLSIDQNGTIINEQFREGLKPFLNKEETHEFTKGSITRYKTRLKLESKMGKLTYLLRRHEKLTSILFQSMKVIICF